MNNIPFDQAAFFIHIDTFPEKAFQVTQFECLNDGISENYQFHLSCHSQSYFSPKDLIHHKARLKMPQNTRHGIIASAICHGKVFEGFHYHFTLSSPLHILCLRFCSRVFLNQPIRELLLEILEGAGLPSSAIQFQLKKNPLIEYKAQYQQTDAEFFQLLLTQYQLCFVWQQTLNQWKLILSDEISEIHNDVKTVYPITDTPIQCLSQYHESSKHLLRTTCHSLQAGELIDVNQQTYRITSISHQVQQSPTQMKTMPVLRYEAQLTLYQSHLQLNKILSISPITQIAPLMNAKTESTGGLFPHIDQCGRYFTRLAFDASSSAPTQASPPEVLLQPNSNGVHFPQQAKTEMAVSYLEGNINKPILLGVFPNPSTPTTITTNNQRLNIHRTLLGQTFLMEDTKGHEKIQLFDTSTKNSVLLDANQKTPRLQLNSPYGQIQLTADKNVFIQTQGNFRQYTTQRSQTVIKEQYQLTAAQQQLSAGRDLSINTKNECHIESNAGNILLDIQSQVALTSKAFKLESMYVQLESQKGRFQFYAKVNLEFYSQVTLTFSQTSGTGFILNKTGIVFNAETLSINTKSITYPDPIPP